MAVNKYGGGARTNINGLNFEQETSLEESLLNAGYIVTEKNIVKDISGKCLGIVAQKHQLYKIILEPEGIDWKNYISKIMYPDDVFLNFTNNVVYIIEKKFQNSGGSVDEKLQTCDFKKKQYQKLFRDTNYDIEYIYVCNDFFDNPKYNDVFDYIKSVGCYIFFNEIPLDFLDLPCAD